MKWILTLWMTIFCIVAALMSRHEARAQDTPAIGVIIQPDGTVIIPMSREQLERVAADRKNASQRTYAYLALEILRLREQCEANTGIVTQGQHGNNVIEGQK